MPSPDEDLPSHGSAQVDAKASPLTPAHEVTPAAPVLPATHEAPPKAAPGAASSGEPGNGAHGEGHDPSDDHGSDGADDPGGDDAPERPGDGVAGAAPGGAPGAAPRKRRRRRRKKGAGHVGQAAAGAADSGEAAATDGSTQGDQAKLAEGSGEPRTADGGEGKKDPSQRTEGKGTGKGGKGKGRGKGNHGHKPTDKPREPRERPAFGVGDVVFGKILEITDDAILVDLSGKAKGIFDRAEMLLPDDPPDAPPAAPPDAPSEPHPRAEPAEHAFSETDALAETDEVVAATAPASSSAAAPVDDAASPPEAASEVDRERGAAPAEADADVPPTVTSGGVERKGRRIIVAAGARIVDAPPSTTPDAVTLELPTAREENSEAPTATAEGQTSAEEVTGEHAEAAAERTAEHSDPPKPAPYAPPIVLEVGAHFVALVHNDGARGGLVVLTRHPRRVSQAKSHVAAALRENKVVHGLVTGVVKGGVEVDVDGLRAFVPGSHMDRRPGSDLHKYIAHRLEFSVTQYGKRGRDVVLSRKAQVEAEAKASRKEALAKLAVGSIVDGVVKSVVGFGAFLDVGGVEGLVSLPEMSHNRGDSPSDVFKVGETMQVKILRIDDKGKVWLSRKAAYADPRLEAFKKYPVGSRHPAKVVRLQPFGAFLELEPGIDGLIHTLDLSMKRIEHPSEVVKVGDTMDVVVSSVDHANQKIALHPAPTGAVADEAPQRIQLHKPLKVMVVAIDPGGLIVRVLGATGRHSRGFITAAATGTARGTELRKPFPIGTQLEAKVVEFDPKRGDLKLSIKALREDSERNAYQQYRQQVNREAKFGTFGDLLAKKGLPTK